MEQRKEAVCGVIFNATRTEVLLIKRRDIPVWVLPGGGIDPLESPETAVIREVMEETGFSVEIVRKVAEYISVNKFTQPTHFFECRILSGQASLGSETKDVKYFPVDRLPNLLSPPYEFWIKDALHSREGILRKKIEGVSYWVFIKLLLKHPILVGRYLLTRMGIHINR